MTKRQPEAAPATPSVTDRRFWSRREDEGKAPAHRLPTVLEELQAQNAHLEQTLGQWQERLRQHQEEFAQFRARLEKDAAEQRQRDRGELLAHFLDLADHLDQWVGAAQSGAPLTALGEAAALIQKQMRHLWARLGVTRLEPTAEPFDPRTSEAVETAPVPAAQEGLVIETLRPGYRYGEQLLRPARVKVGRSQH